MSNFTITGVTSEEIVGLIDLKTFSGKNAGICYQKEGYFNSPVSDPEKASKRFPTVAKTGHHSISDHAQVTVVLENISKMLAMTLNSLQYYATSEKSGRYTVMTGNSKEEQELYLKWKDIYRDLILQKYPDIDDIELSKRICKKWGIDFNSKTVINRSVSHIKEDEYIEDELKEFLNDESLPSFKLAQENARYILSVFTRSTTMSYTTSLRQWNYIYDWCIKFMKNYEKTDAGIFKNAEPANFFEQNLYQDFEELSDFIKDNLYVEELRDIKGRAFDFLGIYSGQNNPITLYEENVDDKLGFNYTISYPASFVQIAQAQRHRTITYWMLLNKELDEYFYVPPILEGTKYEYEWRHDLESVTHIIPQATMFLTVESGTLDDFILKCEERLCGRAQLEVMERTKKTARLFLANYSAFSPMCQAYLDKLRDTDIVPKTKCKLLGTCKEPCRWGCENALNRKI